jgi:hypothetical protein
LITHWKVRAPNVYDSSHTGASMCLNVCAE